MKYCQVILSLLLIVLFFFSELLTTGSNERVLVMTSIISPVLKMTDVPCIRDETEPESLKCEKTEHRTRLLTMRQG